MLLQRVITALVLVALLLGTLAAPSPWPFALLTLALLSAAGWEWGRLNQAEQAAALSMGFVIALGGAAAMAAGWTSKAPAALWWGSLALWLVAGAVALRSGPSAWPKLPRAARWLLGLLALWAAWLALAQAHAIGINYMLSVLCLVWMADVAAYFGGRALGRRKLAPSISPGKSWEGVWSGMAGVVLLALLWIWIDGRFAVGGPSLYTRLHGALGAAGLALGLVLLSGLSVVGDLVESLVKRAAGAKDSSRLLPGHGGVLDRVDALVPVLPAALALTALAGWR
ncbi:MAG: phosphatidate cytidylyltransferase [Leptothrix sp. (in: Bacteria)]|nr:phosphatidate cytidylyltransferase [Leptothrix sp. (in: b-proteobacteria)]